MNGCNGEQDIGVAPMKGDEKMVRRGNSNCVLLIDDDPHIHDLVVFHLEDRVGSVISAHDAKSGRSLAIQERPALILLDIRMPGEDGVSLCRQLQTHPETREIPVVFLTGCEQDLLPHSRALEEDPEGGLEEERRLFYVGVTRARRRLTLTRATTRLFFGETRWQNPPDSNTGQVGRTSTCACLQKAQFD